MKKVIKEEKVEKSATKKTDKKKGGKSGLTPDKMKRRGK